ncbi:hypothetical protein NL676_034956 [Syzygium grande]|nr:hypothetical protein NL676_034956 [Syzygium grande]
MGFLVISLGQPPVWRRRLASATQPSPVPINRHPPLAGHPLHPPPVPARPPPLLPTSVCHLIDCSRRPPWAAARPRALSVW